MPLKILILEDDKVNSKMLKAMLVKTSLDIQDIQTAYCLGEAVDLIRERPCDVALVDLNLPDSEGMDTLIRFTNVNNDIAIVVVTGEYGEELGLQTLGYGAQEYLVKGKYDIYTLAKSISYAIERKRADVAQRRLLKEVESTNKELKDFAYVVSHDLKAPLRGISALAKWISEDYADKLDEEGQKQLLLLLSRVEKMHDLIEGILQYSRIGRVREELDDVDLNQLVPDIIDMIAPPEHIQIQVSDELPVLHIEKTRISQVFQNLIGNAVKYMDKDQGRISITCRDQDQDWRICIEDNGPGISEKDYDRIFKIFQTGSENKEESTGVGLTVVKKIIEMYGGRVWVESEPEKGSIFLFELPKTIHDVSEQKI